MNSKQWVMAVVLLAVVLLVVFGGLVYQSASSTDRGATQDEEGSVPVCTRATCLTEGAQGGVPVYLGNGTYVLPQDEQLFAETGMSHNSFKLTTFTRVNGNREYRKYSCTFQQCTRLRGVIVEVGSQ